MTFYGRCHSSRKAVESRVQKRRGTTHDNTWQSLIAHLPPLPPDPATESLFWCIEQGISLASLVYPTICNQFFQSSSIHPITLNGLRLSLLKSLKPGKPSSLLTADCNGDPHDGTSGHSYIERLFLAAPAEDSDKNHGFQDGRNQHHDSGNWPLLMQITCCDTSQHEMLLFLYSSQPVTSSSMDTPVEATWNSPGSMLLSHMALVPSPTVEHNSAKLCWPIIKIYSEHYMTAN